MLLRLRRCSSFLCPVKLAVQFVATVRAPPERPSRSRTSSCDPKECIPNELGNPSTSVSGRFRHLAGCGLTTSNCLRHSHLDLFRPDTYLGGIEDRSGRGRKPDSLAGDHLT